MVGSLLIKGGRLICPAQGLDRVADLLIRDGRIEAIGEFEEADRVIQADGMVVTPGLIDMHVHFREPGNENEETIASGSAAAVAGGFTAVATMPNTDPPVDDEASVAFQVGRGKAAGLARILPIGCITAGRRGESLAEMGQMARAGAVAFSDDGDCVANSRLMRLALQYAKMLGKPIIDHCEDPALSGRGVMHGGAVSTRLGLPGIPAESEEVMVARDLILAEATGGPLHIAHVSTAGSVRLVREAKRRGIPFTCEATIHHLLLTDDLVASFDTNLKIKPPLRTRADVEAVREAVADGTIDCIVSDHAPHTAEEKDIEFSLAAFGALGLEVVVPLVITKLVEPGILTWERAVAALSWRPAQVLGLEAGTLQVGRPADVTVIDPAAEWTIDVGEFRSKSRNCPYHGRKVRGKVAATIVGGEVKFEAAGAG